MLSLYENDMVKETVGFLKVGAESNLEVTVRGHMQLNQKIQERAEIRYRKKQGIPIKDVII